ncbi:MAG TPA: CoA pyrophosphatase [Pseudomonadales bacterium]|nr:CoA pyrophosphatase [Pseudomonadales bacterium]
MLATLLTYFKSSEPAYSVDPLASQAAVLIPITDEAEPCVILTRRATHLKSHAGEVAFPGGKRDATDPSLVYTALRESEEEIGLSPKVVEVLGMLHPKQSRWGVMVTPFVGKVPPNLALTPNLDELDSIFSVPLRFFLDNAPNSSMQTEVFGQKFRVPSYQYGEYTIWGLTAFILVDLLNRVYDANIDLIVKE